MDGFSTRLPCLYFWRSLSASRRNAAFHHAGEAVGAGWRRQTSYTSQYGQASSEVPLLAGTCPIFVSGIAMTHPPNRPAPPEIPLELPGPWTGLRVLKLDRAHLSAVCWPDCHYLGAVSTSQSCQDYYVGTTFRLCFLREQPSSISSRGPHFTPMVVLVCASPACPSLTVPYQTKKSTAARPIPISSSLQPR